MQYNFTDSYIRQVFRMKMGIHVEGMCGYGVEKNILFLIYTSKYIYSIYKIQ